MSERARKSNTPPPFIVMALPRSRTTWLTKFLSYGKWQAQHDELRHMRSLEDCKAWLDIPFSGFVETMAAPYWRLIQSWRPDARIVIIRRPIVVVAASMQKFGIGPEALPLLQHLDAKLVQVARRWPNALEVPYEKLDTIKWAEAIFRHCLGIPLDKPWWLAHCARHIESSVPAMVRYAKAFLPRLETLSNQAKAQMLANMSDLPMPARDDLEFCELDLDTFLTEAQPLFSLHSLAVNEDPASWKTKNIPVIKACELNGNVQILVAKSNGRIFGYVTHLMAQSLEAVGRTMAMRTGIYADPALPGLGLRLEREALKRLREKGVDEAFFRAGPRGAGDRQVTIFRRLGAVPDGELFKLSLRGG